MLINISDISELKDMDTLRINNILDFINENDTQSKWEKLSEEDKEFIKSLPNFDASIFKECTGIQV